MRRKRSNRCRECHTEERRQLGGHERLPVKIGRSLLIYSIIEMRILAVGFWLLALASAGCGSGTSNRRWASGSERILEGHEGYQAGAGISRKDLPGLKLPLTPAGEAAWKHNTTATVDPEAICILGGIPRHNASGLPFMVMQTPQYVAFLYFYSYYRLIPTDGRKHEEDPDPSFFGDEVGHWDGDAFVIDSVGFKDTQVWADENGSPHSDALHVVERWTRPDAKHIHVDTTIEDPKFYTKTVHLFEDLGSGRSGSAPGRIFLRGKHRGPGALGFGPGPIRPDGTRGYVNAVPLPPPPPPPMPIKKQP